MMAMLSLVWRFVKLTGRSREGNVCPPHSLLRETITGRLSIRYFGTWLASNESLRGIGGKIGAFAGSRYMASTLLGVWGIDRGDDPAAIELGKGSMHKINKKTGI